MEEKLLNISITEFKNVEGVDKVDIVDHPDFKLFASCSNGKKFKAQGNLDVNKTVEFLYTAQVNKTTGEITHTEDAWNEGCFINPSEANVILSL
jgi:hypothetical protein